MKKSLYKKRDIVCVVGLGFVGSATSIAIALSKNKYSYNFDVIGLEKNNSRGKQIVNKFNNGIFPFQSTDNLIKSSLKKQIKINLKASTDIKYIAKANVIVCNINLDIQKYNNNINVKFDQFKKSITEISKLVNPKSLIIIETTVPPGTCKNIVAPIIRNEFRNRGIITSDILLAHSYERVMPGENYLNSIRNHWRVYSGINKKSEKKCHNFLKKFINSKKYPLYKLPNTNSSECAKIIENSYRALNIAFIDEWNNFSLGMDIDLNEVINSIKIRPSHSNLMSPGLGVGGYCLTKDPLFGYISSKNFLKIKKNNFPLSTKAIEINNSMPLSSFNFIKKNFSKKLFNKKIILFGGTYRENIADTRNAPVTKLIKLLLKNKNNIVLHDPYIEKSYFKQKIAITKKIDILSFDLAIFCVPHKVYKKINFNNNKMKNNKITIFDVFNVLTKNQIKQINKLNIKNFIMGSRN